MGCASAKSSTSSVGVQVTELGALNGCAVKCNEISVEYILKK